MGKKVKKVTLREGTLYAVPLGNQKYIVGLVARVNSQDLVVSYFFSTEFCIIPALDTLQNITIDKTILVTTFYNIEMHSSIVGISWPVIGVLYPWNRQDWPVPQFYREDLFRPGKAMLDTLSDKTLQPVFEKAIMMDEAIMYPRQRYASTEGIIAELTRLLNGTHKCTYDFSLFYPTGETVEPEETEPDEAKQFVVIYASIAGVQDIDAVLGRLYQLEDALDEYLVDRLVGKVDGSDVGGDWFLLYVYGKSAKRLWKAIKPIVQKYLLIPGSYVILQCGEPGEHDIRIDL